MYNKLLVPAPNVLYVSKYLFNLFVISIYVFNPLSILHRINGLSQDITYCKRSHIFTKLLYFFFSSIFFFHYSEFQAIQGVF